MCFIVELQGCDLFFGPDDGLVGGVECVPVLNVWRAGEGDVVDDFGDAALAGRFGVEDVQVVEFADFFPFGFSGKALREASVRVF